MADSQPHSKQEFDGITREVAEMFGAKFFARSPMYRGQYYVDRFVDHDPAKVSFKPGLTKPEYIEELRKDIARYPEGFATLSGEGDQTVVTFDMSKRSSDYLGLLTGTRNLVRTRRGDEKIEVLAPVFPKDSIMRRGDQVVVALGPNVSEELDDTIRAALGVDKPYTKGPRPEELIVPERLPKDMQAIADAGTLLGAHLALEAARHPKAKAPRNPTGDKVNLAPDEEKAQAAAKAVEALKAQEEARQKADAAKALAEAQEKEKAEKEAQAKKDQEKKEKPESNQWLEIGGPILGAIAGFLFGGGGLGGIIAALVVGVAVTLGVQSYQKTGLFAEKPPVAPPTPATKPAAQSNSPAPAQNTQLTPTFVGKQPPAAQKPPGAQASSVPGF